MKIRYRKAVKAARYSDAVPYEDRRYWYFTTHGIGPGMLPKGVNILDTQEGQNRKGTWGDYILLDAVLNTDELREYDLVELAPKSVEDERFAKSRSESNWDNYIFLDDVESSCNRKSVKAGYQLQFPYMVEGEFADGYTYTAGGNSEAECVETLANMQDKHGELVWYSGITDEDYDAGRRIDSACSGKKKVKASTGNKHRSKIMAGPGAGYTIKWTLDKIDSVNSFNVVNVSRMDNYGTVTVTADCDVDVTVTIDSAWSYSYGFSDPIENVPAKITRIIFDMYTPDWSFLDPNDYEDGEDDEAYQEAVESAIYALTEEDAIKVLEDEAWENIKGDEYSYGGGYIHSTYDGTLNEIDGDYNWVDIKITDEAVINYIDRCVSGDCTSTSYVLYDSDNEIIETFNDLKEAESVAWDLTDVGEYDYIDIWEVDDFENLNGDVEITGDRFIETIPERDDDEVLPWEDEEEY